MYKKIYVTEQAFEGPFGPSLVEPCHNLSLEELLRDYTRGIFHSERHAFYDDGDELPDEPVEIVTDLAEINIVNSLAVHGINSAVTRGSSASARPERSASAASEEAAAVADEESENGESPDER